jgi:preprotein translocase subunit SecE
MSKIRTYLQETSNELINKVSWPTWKELQDSAVIVMIASLIFAVIVFLMDTAFNKSVSFIYQLFA